MSDRGKLERNEKLSAMEREERLAFCREVVERFSELVEGEAPEQVQARVREVFGDCACYAAYEATLKATIDLARECADCEPQAEWLDDEAFRACVERVRERLGD